MKFEGDHEPNDRLKLNNRTKNRPHINYEIPDPEDRREKPWQRVPSYFIILVLGFYLLLAYSAQLVEDEMPRPVTDADVIRDNSIAFSEEMAMQYLYTIMGDKPRVAGTEYHLQKTEDLQALLVNITRDATLPVTVVWQIASTGSFRLEHEIPYVTWYNNVSNIIALLEGESGVQPNGDLGSTLLLNCHHDSVPFALGASDNVAFCAIMAEVLHRVSQRTTKFKHNVIFLFNGAEENALQGSHAFLQHQWSRNISAVVNMDAAGMNGKANLFQVLDPRFFHAYVKSTNRPSAQSFGEFVFGSGMVPSDTDFRVWRDFGHFYGIDIAFTKWGNVYHTRNDNPTHLQPGVLQAAGDMLLNLVLNTADMPDLDPKVEPTTLVYYDYMNSFVVSYPLWAAYILDVVFALVALASVGYYVCIVGVEPTTLVYYDYMNSFVVSYPLWAAYILDVVFALVALASVGYYVCIVGVRKSTFRGLAWSALGRLVSTVAAFVVGIILILIMGATTTQLRYLSRQWIAVPIYWIPYVIVVTLVSQYYDAWSSKKSGLNRSFRSLEATAATRFILAVILLVMTCVPALTTMRYVVAVPLFLMSVFSVVPLMLARYLRVPAWKQLFAEMLVSVPTLMFLFSLCLRINALMLPVMGRSASNTPDFTVGLLNLGLAALVTSAVSGTELLFSRKRVWLPAGLAGLAALVIMFLPLEPYDAAGTGLQRHYWFHTEIINHTVTPPTRTSGVTVTKIDPYSITRVKRALADSGLNYTVKADLTEDCQQYVFCNLPMYRTRLPSSYAEALFIEMPPPTAFPTLPSLRLESRVCSGTNCTLTFAVDGPAFNTFTLWPRVGSIVGWSLDAPCDPSFMQNGRPVYTVVEATATYQDPFDTLYFWITLEVPVAQQSQVLLDVAQHAHKKQHTELFTREYQQLLDAMPAYVNVDSSLSVRNNYAF